MFLAPQNCWQSWHSANYFIKEDLKFDCKEWQVQRELHAGIIIKKNFKRNMSKHFVQYPIISFINSMKF